MSLALRRTLRDFAWFVLWMTITLGGTVALIHWLHP